MTTYKRIERDTESNDYDGYVPKAGDVWCFHDGQKWPVAGLAPHGLTVGPTAGIANLSPTFLPVRSLTSHIERPVRTVTVPKEGYVPKVGDRLCGPEGVVMTVAMRYEDGSVNLQASRFVGLAVRPDQAAAIVDLATRIERDED